MLQLFQIFPLFFFPVPAAAGYLFPILKEAVIWASAVGP